MEQERLDAIKARCAAATEGPWVRSTHGFNIVSRPPRFEDGRSVVALRLECGSGVPESERADAQIANAEFIAHARQDLPELLAEVERLTQLMVERVATDARNPALDPADTSSHWLSTVSVLRNELQKAESEAERLRAELAASQAREARIQTWMQAADMAVCEGLFNMVRDFRERAAALREGAEG